MIMALYGLRHTGMRTSSVAVLLHRLSLAKKARFSSISSLRNVDPAIQNEPAKLKGKIVRLVLLYFVEVSFADFLQHGGLTYQPKTDSPDPLWLRDCCTCPLCVDMSTKQKQFQTSDLPLDLKVSSLESLSDGGIRVTWSNDIAGFGKNHISKYSKEFLSRFRAPSEQVRESRVLWNKEVISRNIKFIDFDKYISLDSVLFNVLEQLQKYGLVFIRGVPGSETAVEDIGRRIGLLKDTLYGRTWDVKSVPQAKNVAYTDQFLGLHMDLLYTDMPPELQLLHCLKNSCVGGSSLFSDSLLAATTLRDEHSQFYDTLKREKTTFHYHNAGEHYEFQRPTIVESTTARPNPKARKRIDHVNWSPPFQGPLKNFVPFKQRKKISPFRLHIEALKAFASYIEAPSSIYEYRMQEGECVIFNNRRILHARRAFDINTGERWLKGAYLDKDVMLSRYTDLLEKYGDQL